MKCWGSYKKTIAKSLISRKGDDNDDVFCSIVTASEVTKERHSILSLTMSELAMTMSYLASESVLAFNRCKTNT